MQTFSFKKTIISGVALALPLAVVAYVVFRSVQIFEKIISPFAERFGIEGIFGEITLTVLAIVCLLLLVFFLGLMMQFSFVSNGRKLLEEMILKIIPSLNHLKLMAAEKLDTGDVATNWKPVLLESEEGFIPAYLIEETDGMATFSKIKTPGTEPGDILVSRKDGIRYTEISMSQLRQFNKQFGKGYISLIEK